MGGAIENHPVVLRISCSTSMYYRLRFQCNEQPIPSAISLFCLTFRLIRTNTRFTPFFLLRKRLSNTDPGLLTPSKRIRLNMHIPDHVYCICLLIHQQSKGFKQRIGRVTDVYLRLCVVSQACEAKWTFALLSIFHQVA